MSWPVLPWAAFWSVGPGFRVVAEPVEHDGAQRTVGLPVPAAVEPVPGRPSSPIIWHDRAGHDSGNSRNGVTPKRQGTEVGDIDVATPEGPQRQSRTQVGAQGERRSGRLSDMIVIRRGGCGGTPGSGSSRSCSSRLRSARSSTPAIRSSLSYQLRKIIKNRGHFPNDEAVVKLLWLAIRDIEDKRSRERARKAGRPKNEPSAPPQLVEGGLVQGWNAAYGALSLAFPGRLDPRI
jgi:hypothetical protein